MDFQKTTSVDTGAQLFVGAPGKLSRLLTRVWTKQELGYWYQLVLYLYTRASRQYERDLPSVAIAGIQIRKDHNPRCNYCISEGLMTLMEFASDHSMASTACRPAQ
jgi:hypothetical protein